MVHLSHVIILNQCLQNTLRYIPNGVLMLQHCLTWVAVLMDINLEVFSVADVQEEEEVLEVSCVLDLVFEEERVGDCGC